MRIYRVSGAVVEAEEARGVAMHEIVKVGEEALVGEVIRIDGDHAFIQVYEDTYGLRPGERVEGTGSPLSVELGPGLLGTIYDGVQRPLTQLKEKEGIFIRRGVGAEPLDRKKKWHFVPSVAKGVKVEGGEPLGEVQETEILLHRVLTPPGTVGVVTWIAPEGDYSLEEAVAELDSGQKLFMYQRWPVREPRPYRRRLAADQPLITGQRVIDTLFPMAKGGSGIIPGGFGTGKTIVQHQLAKWADADVVVYVGCGERGNEMTEVLRDFPKLKDPRSGKPLMMRTVLIANTSNMPVAAREASIYTGITIAEYFRDMGYNVALMADSTSRWAEALREISGRLEEMPGEEGYPPYLASRLAEFYERAGRVETLSGKEGSVTVVGAVSPMGGDFSEPVTQNSLRFVQVFWALDKDLADRRHFPAINWTSSYSQYIGTVESWWVKNVGEDWPDLVRETFRLLQTETELESLVRLVGVDALPEDQKLELLVARVIREGFLQQNAFNDVDTFFTPKKQYLLLKSVIGFYRAAREVVDKRIPVAKLEELPIVGELMRARFTYSEEAAFEELVKRAGSAPKALIGEIDRGESKMQAKPSVSYATISQINGPLVFVKGIKDVGYDELVEVRSERGKSLGRVLDVSRDVAVVEVFEGTTGLSIGSTSVSFLGSGLEVGLSQELLGRVFDGIGQPADGKPAPYAREMRDVNGSPINPTAREYPSEFIETGVSGIDGMDSLVRGQKLPIFSGAGLPHNALAAQITRQAKLLNSSEGFAVVFVAIGITHDEAMYFRKSFEESGALANVAMVLNLADSPPVERITAPRVGLTMAEYLAFEEEMHVLVILTDMTNYCNALREISSSRGEIPARKGYPGYMYTDLASIYERAGKVLGKKGSVTLLPILTMPNDDISHPIPDLTGYITEGQIVLDRGLYRKGVYPPIDIALSLSRLMKDGVGKGYTREDHMDLSNQLYASYARMKEVRSLETVVGEEGLSEKDKMYLKFGDFFEQNFLKQGENQDRTIEETLDLGWQALSLLPEDELTRVSGEEIKKYMKRGATVG